MRLTFGKTAMIFKLKKQLKKDARSYKRPNVATNKLGPQNYFHLARNWSDDFYAAAQVSRNRWRAACLYGLLPFSFLLLLCVMMLIPMQHIEPLLINHYENGLVSVVPFKQPYAPANKAQVESEIVRYVVNRESFSSASYNEQYSLVNLLSNNTIAGQYNAEQNIANKHSPINTLGNKGYRTVHVESVVFLDNADQNNPANNRMNHRNLAQVNFSIIEHDKTTGRKTSIPRTALISWQYRGVPANPKDMWRNWDGFAVTQYSVEQRNI